MYCFLEFSGLKTKIRIEPEWFVYLKENQEVIREWIHYEMIRYLQRRNPGVPDVSGKLSPLQERKPERSNTNQGDIKKMIRERDIPISRLELSARAYNVLRLNDINWLSEILSKDFKDLRKMPFVNYPIAEEIYSCAQMSQLRIQNVKWEEADRENTKAVAIAESFLKGNRHVFADDDPIEILLLSDRSYNCLKRAGINKIGQLKEMPYSDLIKIRNLGQKSIREIEDTLLFILNANMEQEAKGREEDPLRLNINAEQEAKEKKNGPLPLHVSGTDPIDDLNLSVRSTHYLNESGIFTISQLLDYPTEKLYEIRNLGKKSVGEIVAAIQDLKDKIWEFSDDEFEEFETEFSKDELAQLVMKVFVKPFKGYSFPEIRAAMPDFLDDSSIKQAVGSLLSEGKLEYVDFRCYKTYPSFYGFFQQSLAALDERSKEVIQRRIAGDTLDIIGNTLGITRERVRQISKKAGDRLKRNMRSACKKETGSTVFDEDFYEGLYTKCMLPDEFWSEELGLSENSIKYLNYSYKRGSTLPEDILNDEDIPVSLRYRVRNYLDRGKILIDEMLFPRNRSSIEDYALQKFARDELGFERFIELYNSLLETNGIPYDEKLYYSESNILGRKNRFAESDRCLWKQGERVRYYDIPSRDYSDLLEALHLDGYHNTEVSTLKFMDLYPELMERYDIRDQYELHNLLKKIAQEYDLNAIKFSRQPIMQFGKFDRQTAILEIITALSPVTQQDLIEYLYLEYGYDRGTAVGYLSSFSSFYYNGEYKIGSSIPKSKIAALEAALTDDFYYIDEIKKIYLALFPNAEEDEINGFTLKKMGFSVYSNYAIQNYPSSRDYFIHLLTKEDVYNIKNYNSRYGSIQMYNQILSGLLEKHVIFRFDKDSIISLRRLECFGVSANLIENYCAEVRDFVENDSYFTIESLRQDGFSHKLDELGFDDFFYASLLRTDDYISSQRCFGSVVLYNGKELGQFSSEEFILSMLREHDSIDPDDFIRDMKDRFGVTIPNRREVITAVKGTELYYDSIMDKVYRDKTLYYNEIDE